jgi:hypothetical protein
MNNCANKQVSNPRNLSEIKKTIGSHDWKVMSADKSPWGIISRFACPKCDDELVVMLTSSRASRQEEVAGAKLEVSVKDVVFS